MLYIHRLQVIIQKKEMDAGATDLDPLYFGMPGLLCLLASLWIFTGSVSLTFDVKQWQTEDSLLYSIISYQSIIRFIHFIVTSMSLAGIAFIVKYFYWDKQDNINIEYEEYSKKFNTWLAITFTGLQPLFFICIMFFTPFNAISMLSFTMLLFAVVLVFILIHFLYAAIKDGHFQVSSYSLYLMIIIFAVIIIKEQSSYDYASRDHILKLAGNYDKAEAELAANFEKQPEINGKDIYEVKCMACHRFDVKLVGPPHKVVMEKYINNREGMIQFILNPQKVNPDYPAMPSQGLTPKEVKAVVDYMWKAFGDKVGK